jgi:cyclin A
MKNIITDYDDDNLKKNKKNLKHNCISDINEISIEGIRIIKKINKDEEKEKEKEREKGLDSDINFSKSLTIDNKIKKINKKQIKIAKKKKINLKNVINSNLNINGINNFKNKDDNDNNYEEEKNANLEKEKNKNESQSPKVLMITKKNDKGEDPQQAKEYIYDIIESLLIEEDYYLNKKKYINPLYLENDSSELTPEMRTVAVDWLVLIHHQIFKFKENTLFLTIQIFDRYLSKKDLNTEKMELLLLASFMVASKHNEIDYVNMQETLQLAQNKFSKEQVIEMESEILSQINFELLSPTMCEYFSLFASYLNLNEEKINHGFYILNIILVDYHMLEYPNFMLALAVVKLITKKFNQKLIEIIKNILKNKKIYKFLEYLDGEEYNQILDICYKIKLLYNTFLETKYKNIQEKFAQSKYYCVSSFTSI